MPVKLENISSVSPNSSGQIDVPSDLNLVGTSPNPVYRINGVPLATGQNQTPWLSNIDAAAYVLGNVRMLGLGVTPPTTWGATNSWMFIENQYMGIRFSCSRSDMAAKSLGTFQWQDLANTQSDKQVASIDVTTLSPSTPGNRGTRMVIGLRGDATTTSQEVIRLTAQGMGILGGSDPIYPLEVAGDVNLVGVAPVYRINGVPLAAGQNQTPWLSDINGNNFSLGNAGTIGIGTSLPLVNVLMDITGSLPFGAFIGGARIKNTNSEGSAGYSAVNDNNIYFGMFVGGSQSWEASERNVGFVVSQGDMAFKTREPANERMRITQTGNVGIGTANPTTTLDVYGGAIVRADASGLDLNPGLGQLQVGGLTNPNQRLYMGFDTTNNCGVIQPGVAFVGWNNLILNPTGGNVGIGTSNPGTILSTGTSTAPIKIGLYDSGPGSAVTYGVGVQPGMLTFGAAIDAVSGIPQMVLTAAGSVGIGTATPGSRLSIVGLPTSAAGLSPGDVWNNGGVLNIV